LDKKQAAEATRHNMKDGTKMAEALNFSQGPVYIEEVHYQRQERGLWKR
jgi:hypothetical protein